MKQFVPAWSSAGLALYWFLVDPASVILSFALIVIFLALSYVYSWLKMLYRAIRAIQIRLRHSRLRHH